MSRQDYFRTYEATRGPRDRTDYARSYGRARRAAAKAKPKTCIGLDGEGFESGSCYAYLAAWSKAGEIDSVENLRGLPTFQCLDFLLGLPAEPLKFGFSLGYDYTHWLKDLGNKELYALNHVEMRQAKKGPPRPVLYRHPLVEGQYALNLLSSRLSVTKLEGHKGECEDMRCPGCRPRHRVVVWDVFKFFQSSFIAACLAWGVITEAEFEVLDRMKKERPNFRRPKASDDPAWVEIKNYCGLECGKMADLAERLLQAHDDAGLQLKSYYGAGSTGAAMLEKMGVRRFIHVNKKRIEHTPEVRSALAHAFFGGRFEILHYGSIPEDLFSYDISSAYPYAFTFLPCLAHGAWERVAGRNALAEIERADGALVRYRLPWVSALGKNERDAEGRLRASRTPWGPFPFRDGDGNILFPVTSGGGWVHKTEFLAALAAYPNVELVEAWIYKVQCSCEVLRQLMPENYKLRLRWGKEGKGIVSKLGQNSCYGKAAQTKGANPPYQSFMWAGMTTASCRAQVTRAMARDFEGIVMIATDGIVSRRRLALDGPRDTGTFDAVNDKGKPANKPLGGWEEKALHGMHLIRPGIAFPLRMCDGIRCPWHDKPEKEKDALKESRARGIGKAVLRGLRNEVVAGYAARGPEALQVVRPMFFGMKSQMRKVGSEFRRGRAYGRFADQPVQVSYTPTPKRPIADGERLLAWALPDTHVSQPYGPILGRKVVVSDATRELMEDALLEMDQPDGDVGNIDLQDEF